MRHRFPPVVVVGLGQLGGVFAHALLRAGRVVVPLNRGDDPASLDIDPALVLLTVGEAELDTCITSLPEAWRDRVALVQNELLPSDWERHGLAPTVAVVWFEKKKTIATHVIQPTPIAGPHAALLVDALATLGIEAREIEGSELPTALVAKNVYILTANLGGLAVGGGTVGALWNQHRDFAEPIAREVIALQERLLGSPVDTAEQLARLEAAFAADSDHQAMGRSASARLERALAAATELNLEVPRMRALQPE